MKRVKSSHFSNYSQIFFTQNLIIKSHWSIGTSSTHMLPTQKHSMFTVLKWVFPLASGLLTYGSRDLFSNPLDHYLTLGQQVMSWLLELQEVPISPQRLSSCSYQQANHQKTGALHRAWNKQHPHLDALCIPRYYLHYNQPERLHCKFLRRINVN